VDGNVIRSGNNKLRAFWNYPKPTSEKELDQFEYMTTYLRKFIPGRADHFRIIRKSVIKILKLAAVSAAKNAAETNATETKAAETKAAENRNKAVGNQRMANKRKVKMREIGFKWSEEAEKSFQVVKRWVLANACHGGDPDRQYHLACDAFSFAYGGVLFQLAAEHPAGTVMSSQLVGSMRIVQFISKKLLDAETRYHTTEREALAIVRCLEETRWLVNENRHSVLIYTDHECLKTAFQNTNKGRIMGWQQRLSEYDFRIIHIKGKDNALADGMSRLPVEVMDFGRLGKEESALELMNAVAFTRPLSSNFVAVKGQTTNSVVFMRPSTSNFVAVKGPTTNSVAFARPGTSEVAVASDEEGADKWWEYWLADEWYAGVVFLKLFGKLREKDGGEDSLTVWRWWTQKVAAYQLIDEPDDDPLLAYTERNGRRSWCVRESEVSKVLDWDHDCHGYYAVDLTVKRLIGHYYWPTRIKDTHTYCWSCRTCQLTGGRLQSQIPRPIIQLQPIDMIGIDSLGPFSPESNPGGHRYTLIAMDYFTRYPWVQALPAVNGPAVIDLVVTISKTFRLPRSVYTNNATYFVRGAFPNFLASRGVEQFPAPKTHPLSVGLLERYVQLVLYGIRKIVVGGGNLQGWSAYLDQVAHSMNTREV